MSARDDSGDGSRLRRARWTWWVALALVMLGGFVLRTWNLDFDQRQHLHPDERHWSLTSAAMASAPAPDPHGTAFGPLLDWLDGQRSPANAYRGSDSFVYGAVTLAAGRATAGWLLDGATTGAQPASAVVDLLDAVGLPLLDADGAPRFDDAYQVDLIGRMLGAIADTLTILVVALIGRRVAGRAVGLAGAVLYGLSVMAIQHAHFFGAEPLLGLASALTVLTALAMGRGDRTITVVKAGGLAGVAAGATVAVKSTGLAVAIVPVLVAVALLVGRRRRIELARLAAVLVGAALAFRVLCPSAFEGLGLRPSARWLDDQRLAQSLARADIPPALQWADRPFLITPLQFLVGYTVGPGTAIAAVAGTVALIRRRAAWAGAWVVVAAWVIPFLVVARQPVTTGRYFVPMMPALHVAAGVGLIALAEVVAGATSGEGRVRARDELGRLVRAAARPAAAVLFVLATLWGLAFVHGVYGHEHTRITASRWIDEHVAPGSVLTRQAWDDGLPLAVDGIAPGEYPSVELLVVAPDSLAKIETLAEQLQGVDVVVESSPRVWGVVGRIPARFPSSIRFFEALDDGTLGFARVASFTSRPRLGPFELAETYAEEAFSVYDHPEVRIWQRRRDVGVDDIVARLDPIAAANAMPVAPMNATANGTLLDADEVAAAGEIPAYDRQFDTDANPWVHAVAWFLVVELLGLAAFVVLLPVLRRLPDAGLGVAKLLGVAAVAFGVFALTTWGGRPTSGAMVAGCGLTLLGAGVVLARRRRAELAELWRERRATLLVAELVGAAAFVVLIALRAANPDLWHPWRGGEKPMELTMLTAVLRARTLPPPDPWFAGGALNYYYGGYLLLSVPARLLRTSPTLALNLAPAFLAMTAATTAYSAATALAVLRPGRRVSTISSDRAWRAGLLGVAFVLLVPNVATLSAAVGHALGHDQGSFDWWAVSRVIAGMPIPTEFPAWSMLFADVHPHVFGLAVLGALVVAVLAWWDTIASAARGAMVVAGGALVGFLLGLARAVNTWDLPLALVIVGVGVVAMVVVAPRRWRAVAASSVAAAAVVIVAWAPYARRTEVTDAGFAGAAFQVPLAGWAAQFGFFAVITLVAAAAPIADWVWRGSLGSPVQRGVSLLGAGSVAAAAALLVADPTAAVSAVLAVVAAVAMWTAWGRHDGTPPFALAVLAMGWLTLVTIEIVHVANDFTLNTIFKGWFQAWLLLAVGAGAALDTVVFTAARRGIARHARRVGWVSLAIAAVTTVAFVQLAVPARLADRVSSGGLSLDGLAFLDEMVIPTSEGDDLVPGEDRPLIEWLQANVEGLPTIAEAPGVGYGWTSRIATHTGLPTVLGWPWHGTQQRRNYPGVIAEREADLRSLYTSADDRVITLVLQRRRIGYVVFGTAERVIATPPARRALAQHPCLDVVVRHGDLWVAAVDQGCIDREDGALAVWPR